MLGLTGTQEKLIGYWDLSLLMVTIFFGYTGYLLPWDELGFAAGSIGLEMATSIPAMGPLMAQIVFGGTQLTGDTITRMYWLHIFVLPLSRNYFDYNPHGTCMDTRGG